MPDRPEIRVVKWRPIEPLGSADHLANGSLVALDALKREWKRYLDALSEDDRLKIRHRTLRRLAVETGIVERIYEIEWGLTLTLVAEGFAREVVERAGGRVDDRTLATLKAQLQSLELVLDFVRENRSLTPSFIKELHSSITRTQLTYVATDSLGRVFDKELVHGDWKRESNHVLRQDNSLLEYAPPEHVASEIDHLVEMYDELEQTAIHPVVVAAWLHHRFVQIHPFADGNGRVARALTLLVLQKGQYAPLVVDRWHRDAYLKCLDMANGGDLAPLVKLFIMLESSALTSELDRPDEQVGRGMALEVAHTLASQIAAARQQQISTIRRQLHSRAQVIGALMKRWFDDKHLKLQETFKSQHVDIGVASNYEMPPDSEKSTWFRREIVESAHRAGHYADFGVFAGWCGIRLRYRDLRLRFVASLHGAGRDVGVMAVTTFGKLWTTVDVGDEDAGPASGEDIPTTGDAFRFVHTEVPADLEKRFRDLEEILEEGLAEALAKLLQRV